MSRHYTHLTDTQPQRGSAAQEYDNHIWATCGCLHMRSIRKQYTCTRESTIPHLFAVFFQLNWGLMILSTHGAVKPYNARVYINSTDIPQKNELNCFLLKIFIFISTTEVMNTIIDEYNYQCEFSVIIIARK